MKPELRGWPEPEPYKQEDLDRIYPGMPDDISIVEKLELIPSKSGTPVARTYQEAPDGACLIINFTKAALEERIAIRKVNGLPCLYEEDILEKFPSPDM